MAEKKDEEKKDQEEGQAEDQERRGPPGWKKAAGAVCGFCLAPLVGMANAAMWFVDKGPVFMGGDGPEEERGEFSKGLKMGYGAFAGACAGAVAGAVVGFAVGGIGAIPGAITGAIIGAMGGGGLVKLCSEDKGKEQGGEAKQGSEKAKASQSQELERQRVRQKEASLSAPERQSQQAPPLPSGTTEVKRGADIAPPSSPSGQARPRSSSQSAKR